MAPKAEAPAPPKFAAWAVPVEKVAQYYEVDLAKGLSPSDVSRKRKIYGWNELDKEDGKPLWKLVLEQFDDPLVKVGGGTYIGVPNPSGWSAGGIYACDAHFFHFSVCQILLLAAAVSFGISWFEEAEGEKGIGHFIEPMVIVLILVLNATVGVWMVRPKHLNKSRSEVYGADARCSPRRRAMPRALWRPSRRCSLSMPRSSVEGSW